MTSASQGPLKGIKILDLSTAFSGPICTSLLADQGAQVIKVENVGMGEVTRYSGASRNGMSGLFHLANRGKRSLAVNMKNPRGIAIVKKLIANSDVVIQNLRHGAVERLGIDYDAAQAINPDIIYLSITGYGNRGALAKSPVYDNVMQAFAGFADLERTEQTPEPSLVQNMIVDKVTALNSAQAISAALFARASGRGGQHIQVSMLDCGVNFLWVDSAMEAALPGDAAVPAIPTAKKAEVMLFKNGAASLSPLTNDAFHCVCETLKVDGHDPRLKTTLDRMQNTKLFQEIKQKWKENALLMDVDEVVDKLQACDVPCAKVHSLADLPEHPQVKAAELFQHATHPVMGEFIEPRPAALFSVTEPRISDAAPTLGQHTDIILEELEMDDEISELKELGIIQ